ncbi:MAG: metallophosphoesterase [Streptosporangiales bacterium]|nr:metallophosphoesterase [Streptosporangiales bacterium]
MGFVATLLTLIGLIHVYLWKRLVRDTTRAGSARLWGTLLLLAMFAVTLSALLTRSAPVDTARWFAWPGFMWLAVMLYLLVILLALEIPRLAALLTLRYRHRRAFPARAGSLAEAEPASVMGEGPPASVRAAGGLPVPAAHPAVSGEGGTAVADPPGIDRGEPGGLGGPVTGGRAGAVGGGPGGRATGGRVDAAGDRTGGRATGGRVDAADAGPASGADAGASGGGADGVGGGGGSVEAAYLDRRRFLARGFAAAAGVAAAGTVGYGTYTALGPLDVRRVPIALPRLDGAFHGFRVAVVSDIHLGSLRGRAHTERIVRTINGLRPDMIAVVGDLVDGSVPELGAAAAPLRDLEAEHGAYFVTGNHEYYSGVGAWVEEIRELGLRPLLNERAEITRGNAAFDLAGVDDLTAEAEGGGPDYTRALAGRDTGRAVVLLAHQPVLATESARHGVDLQLSGHTHGGQLWPFHYVVRAAQGTVAGRARIGDTELYVTRGAGFWGPPVRVGAPPEVSLIQLHARP